MPPTGAVRRPTPKKRKTVSRGPQGLPTVRTPVARRPVVSNTTHSLIGGVAHTVKSQPKVQRAVRQQARRDRANLRISGDRPTPGGRTTGIDARNSSQYRAVLKYLLNQERRRLGVGSALTDADRTKASVPTSTLESELNMLRATTRHHTQGLLHPLGKDTYSYRYRAPSPLIAQVARYATGRPDPGKVATATYDPEKAAEQDTAAKGKLEGSVDAGALTVLDQLARPVHAIAGAADAAATGKNVGRGALRGLQNKDQVVFGQVLKHLGAPKAVQSTLGFGLDVGLDPTTYVTFGAGGVVRKAAEAEAMAVTRRALLKGLTPEQAQAFGRRAYKGAIDREAERRGLVVKAGGKELPGVRRVTARANRTARSGAQRVPGARKVRDAARHVAADFNPNIVPDALDRETYNRVRQATRTARSTSSRDVYKARLRAGAINKAIGKENYQRVLDAIESGRIRDLPPELQKPARFLRDQFKYVRRVEKRAGIRGGTRKNYVPHVRVEAEKGARMGERSVGSKTIRPASSKARKDDRTLAEIRATDPGKYHEDPGVLYAGRASESAVARSRAIFNRRLIEHGRTIRPGIAPELREGEGLYLIRGSDVAQVTPKEAKAYLEGGGIKRYKLGSRQATVDAAASFRQRAKDIDAEIAQLSHKRSRLVGRQQVHRGQAPPPSRAYYVGVKRFEDRAAADDYRKANGGSVRVVATSRAEAKRVGELSQVSRQIARAKERKAAALRSAKEVDGDLAGRPGTRKPGHLVAINEQAINRALKTIVPGGEKSATGRALDVVQGHWKFLATQPNPGFHLRNLIGDAQNAYLAQSAPGLARSLRHSAKALNELGRQERSLGVLDRAIDPSGKGLKIGGKKVSYADLVREAEKVGGVRSGFVSRELHDLIEGKAPKAGSRTERIRRWSNNREDLIRLATYIGARRRGMTAEGAAAWVAKHHFDYSDLTELERRVLRRVMPFYTFSARNIPLQAKYLLSHPGKFAQYEKLREEFANAFGYQDGWEGDLSPAEQRSVPIPIRIGGKKITLSLGPSGLPLTDLSELPTSLNPEKAADEWLNRAVSMVTPAIKTPVELWANMSFFFREPIEREQGPLVPAPRWVSKIPAKYRKQLGIVPDLQDRRSGEKGWGWPAKVGYAFSVLPGPASYLNRVLTQDERRDWKSKTLGYIGIRAVPVDARSVKINALYDERADIDKKMAALNQRGINADKPSAEYTRLSSQEKDITSHIFALRTKRGDKIIPGGPKPKSSGDPVIDDALGKLRKQQKSRFSDPSIEQALSKLRG